MPMTPVSMSDNNLIMSYDGIKCNKFISSNKTIKMINLIFIFCINITSIFMYKLFSPYSNTRINLKKTKN